jgi:autotransporter-associated beta strand protein
LATSLLGLAAASASAQTFTWTNTAASGNAWSAAANWNPNVAPAAGGGGAYLLNFNAPGANNVATNDLPGSFLLNGLIFSAGNVTLAGGPLEFTNNGGADPALTNSVSAPPAINNDLSLDEDTTLGGTSGYILYGDISGAGGLINNVSPGAWTTLFGNNSYSGATVMTAGSGTLQLIGNWPLGNSSGLLQNGGGLVLANASIGLPVTVNGGYLRWSAGNAYNIVFGPVTIAGGVTLNVNSIGGTSTGSQLHFDGGITSAGGSLEIFDDNSGNSDPGNVWLDSAINLGSGELRGFGSHINASGNVVGAIHPYYGRRISLETDDAFMGAPALIVGGNANGGSGSVGTLDLNGHNLLISSIADNQDSGNEVTSILPAVLTVSNSAPSTFVGALTGAGLELVKDGTSILTLAGNNSYAGGTVVQEGALYLEAGATVGSGGPVSIMAGAIFGGAGSSSGDVTLNNQGILLADGGTGSQALQCGGNLFLGSASTDLTTNAVNVFHGGEIIVSGALNLAGTNVFNILALPEGTGTFDLIRYGSVSKNGVFALGPLPAGISAHLQDSGAAIQLVITASTVEADSWVGQLSGNWDLGGALNWKGSLTGTSRSYHDGDTVVFTDAASNFWVNVQATVAPSAVTVNNSAHSYVFYGVGGVSGATALTKSGSGVLTVANFNSYQGLTTVNGGTLQIGVANALPAAGGLLLNGGSLDLNDQAQSCNTLNGLGLVTNSGVKVPLLTIGNGNGSSSFSGLLAGPVGLDKVGVGTALIAGTNTFTGPVLVDAGSLFVNDLAPLGSSTNVTVGAGLLVLSNATLHVPINASNSYGSNIKWTGPNASNVISGRINILAGPQLNFDSASGNSGCAQLHLTGGVASAGLHLEIFDDNSGNSDPGNVWIDTTPINLGMGEIRGFGSHINVAGNIVGGIHPYYGRRISLEVDNAFVGAPALILGNPSWGQLDLKGHGLLVSSLTDSGDSGNIVTSDPAATLTVSNSVPNTYGGTLFGAGLSLVKTGPGTLNLTGWSDYGGSTAVSAGTLVIEGEIGSGTNEVSVAAGTLAGTGMILDAVTVQPGGTLAPGVGGIGALTITSSLLLEGTVAVDIAKDGADITNDVVQGVSDLTYGGTLVVSLSGATPLALNDRVQLFSAQTYSGVFSDIWPAPGIGLAWDSSRLALDGTLGVIASSVNMTRTNLTCVPGGRTVTLGWPRDHTGWRLLVQTNHLSSGVSANPADWEMVPGSNLTNNMVLPIDLARQAQFYRLVYP